MLLTVLFPGLSLLFNRRPGLGGVFLLLQPTLVGWALGAVVAGRNLRRQRRRRRHSGGGPGGAWAAHRVR
jgi:hypothetical protein